MPKGSSSNKRGRQIYKLLDKQLDVTFHLAMRERASENEKENPISRAIEREIGSVFRAHVSLLNEHIVFYRYEDSQWHYVDKFPTTTALEDWLHEYYNGMTDFPVTLEFFKQDDKDDDRIWVGLITPMKEIHNA